MIAADITDGRREGRGRRLWLPRTSRRMDLAGTARALDFGSFASAAPGSLEVFVARAEARALLYAVGELTLHEAVDELQPTAEREASSPSSARTKCSGSSPKPSPRCDRDSRDREENFAIMRNERYQGV